MLKLERLKRGLKQSEVADLMGVCEETVLHLEKGQTRAPNRLWPKIVEFLGFNPDKPPTGFAEELRYERRLLGKSIKSMAKSFGIDEGTLAAYETEASTPSDKMRQKIKDKMLLLRT